MNEALIPILASVGTLLVTKMFDLIIAKNKDKAEQINAPLQAVDELSSAATVTIKYLKDIIIEQSTEIGRLKNEVELRDKRIDELEELLKS